MKRLKRLYIKFSNTMTEIVSDDERRSEVMTAAIYAAFAVIAFVMSVLNIFTNKGPLLVATSCFCVLSAVDFLLTRTSSKTMRRIAAISFEAGILLLFSYFIITGGTDNFSITWLLLLPTLGLFFFGIADGTVLSAAVMVVMELFFHVPALAAICTDYGETFRMRFPIVYVACYLVSLLLEYIRLITARELGRMNRKFRYLYRHDVLTGVSNRYSADDHFDNAVKLSSGKVGVLMFDIDFFKNVNDTYGHQVGDSVLKEMCDVVRGVLPENSTIHRWGGEEFVIISPKGESIENMARDIHEAINSHQFDAGAKTIPITVSIGAVCAGLESGYKCDELIEKADANLYAAKNSGRNCIISTSA